MNTKDITSKKLLKRIAADMANVLLKLNVDPESVELLETENQRVEERRADLVIKARPRDQQDKVILHIEIQNNNNKVMPIRMLRYYTDIRLAHEHEPIKQYLLYIGKERCRIVDHIEEPGLSYHYELIDMHTIDCQQLLEQNTPEALVLAILCDFKGRPELTVIREIGSRLRMMLHDDDKGFLDYYSMFEILGQNRDLEQQIKDTKEMLTQVDVSRLPSYQWGMEDAENRFSALLAEKEQVLQEQSQVLQEKDQVLQEKDQVLQEQSQVLQEKEQALQQVQAEKEQALKEKDQEQKERDKQLIKKLNIMGMSAKEIASIVELPLTETEAIIKAVTLDLS